MKNGFTIVEIIVVIVILAIVGVLVLNIFAQGLRSNNKAQILSSIKKNGQSVMDTMDKTIRGADNLICVGPIGTANTLVIIKGGKYTRYKFILPTSSANGEIKQDFPEQPTVPPKDNINVFLSTICTDPAGTDSISPAVAITDKDTQSGVSVQNVLFTRLPQPGFQDLITVNVTIGPAIGAPQVLSGQIDPVTFTTTIEIR